MQAKEKIIHYAQSAVPRYTSYPTAADFYAMDDAPRLEALRQIDAGDRISAYIHIPYCRAMCHYCGCFTKITRRPEAIEDYVNHLIADIKLQASYFSGKPRLTHLHWGGGTPSIISRDSFRAVMAALRDAFVFDAQAEHAIELDPRHIGQELAQFLAEQGVNRASLGVQDINPEVQQAIGRIQPLSMIEDSVNALRQAGIEQLNFDLIYGLPLQTRATLRETCEKTAELKPNRIACYGYAHLPQRRAHQRLIDSSALPEAYARFLQAELVGEEFKKRGYAPIGIDHFALPDDPLAKAAANGRLHRNFQGYTDDNAALLLGFGASAISEFPNFYAHTIADIGQYKRAVAAGHLGTARGIALSAEDKRRARIIGDLMCRFAVNLADYGGAGDFTAELSRLEPLLADNIARKQGDIIAATEEGKPFVRLIAALFDAYRQPKAEKRAAEISAKPDARQKTGRFSPAI